MLQHPSARLPAPDTTDPSLTFPSMLMVTEFLLPSQLEGSLSVDTRAGTWKLERGSEVVHQNVLGQNFSDLQFQLSTWPVDSPALAYQAVGSNDPRLLVRYIESQSRGLLFHLEYLDQVRATYSGEGPYPIHLYRRGLDGKIPDPIAEESDILRNFDLSSESPVLAHLRFNNPEQSAILLLNDGRAFGRASSLAFDRQWDSIKFPQTGAAGNSVRKFLAA